MTFPESDRSPCVGCESVKPGIPCPTLSTCDRMTAYRSATRFVRVRNHDSDPEPEDMRGVTTANVHRTRCLKKYAAKKRAERLNAKNHGGKEPVVGKRILAALKAHPELSVKEIAHACGCSAKTVYWVRSQFGKEVLNEIL